MRDGEAGALWARHLVLDVALCGLEILDIYILDIYILDVDVLDVDVPVPVAAVPVAAVPVAAVPVAAFPVAAVIVSVIGCVARLVVIQVPLAATVRTLVILGSQVGLVRVIAGPSVVSFRAITIANLGRLGTLATINIGGSAASAAGSMARLFTQIIVRFARPRMERLDSVTAHARRLFGLVIAWKVEAEDSGDLGDSLLQP